jgi:hypothetical protein
MASRQDSSDEFASSGLGEIWKYVASEIAPKSYNAILGTIDEQIRLACEAASKQAGDRGPQFMAVLTAEVTAEVASEVAAETTAEAHAAPDCLFSRALGHEFAARGQ